MALKRLYALADTAQIAPGWSNFDGTQTIYYTADTGLNVVTLTLVNQLGDTVTLPPGQPLALGSLPAGQSAIYLFFEGMLSNAEVDAINVTSLGDVTWNTATFNDSNSGLAYLVMAPSAQVTVADTEGLAFKLTNILADSNSNDRSGNVYISIVGATGVDPAYADPQIYVNVQNQPATGNQALELLVGFAGSDLVFTGGQANALTLYLTNPYPTALVPGGSSSWGPTPPTFQLSLVFQEGDSIGDGALTSLAEADGIAVDLLDEYGNVWKPVSKQSQGGVPTWIMQPDANGGGTVLGTGEQATVSFALSNIVTQLPQGLTYAYLSYSDIPGYNDGFYAVELLKVDPITVVSFTADPTTVTGATGPASVALAFEVKNASYVTITNTAYAKPVTGSDFSDTATATAYATTTYTLIASNFATGQVVSWPLTVAVSGPDLLSSALAGGSATFADAVTFSDAVTIDGSLNALGLRVTSAGAWLNSGVTVSNSVMVVNDGASVTGGLTADTATVDGTLSASGAATLSGGASVSGGLTADTATVSSSLTVSGSVGMLGAWSTVALGVGSTPTAVQANTDGFAVMQIVHPSSVSDCCWCYAGIQSGGIWFEFQGGNVGQFGSGWDPVMWYNPQVLTVPVTKGSIWWYYAQTQVDTNQSNATVNLYWIPLGRSGSSADTFTILDGADPIVSPPQAEYPQRREPQAQRAGVLIDKLSEVFGKPLTSDARNELIALWNGER